jgi:hypothetical protein
MEGQGFMSVNLNSQNNPQLLQQRLNVREQEINALKVQNRHLLSKVDELATQVKPNQINTKFVADDVHKHLEPVIAQMQSTMTASFEILQSTMRGIYQQSQRAQQAVEEMTSQSRDLEIRMNEQRKSDQNYYQDKIFSMIGAFCDRVERQIEIRLKSLSVVELMNAKQNEVLSDVESMKASLSLMQKNSEASRGEISRIERNASEANEKLIDVQVQTGNTEELIRDTLQQIQNHRSEFKLIRSELKGTLESVNRLLGRVEASSVEVPSQGSQNELVSEMAYQEASPSAIDENKLINDLIENKHRELEVLEKNIEEQGGAESKDDATMILALLRAQKSELQRVAGEAKSYLQNHQASLQADKQNEKQADKNSEKKTEISKDFKSIAPHNNQP